MNDKKSTGVKLYQSKPVEVRAIQYLTLENVQEIQTLLKSSAKFNDDFSIRVGKIKIERGWFVLFTMDGEFKSVMNPESFNSEFEKQEEFIKGMVSQDTKAVEDVPKKGGKQ